MKNILKLIVAPLMLIVVSCDNNPISTSEQLSDNQIIELIQSSEKIEISFDELPSKSQSNIQSEHIDYESFKNWKASGYGYFVELSGRGQSAGNLREVYFDENGRSLGHSNSDDRDRTDGGEDVDCFELILPVTYSMPDGSTIAISSEDDWSSIRSWYESNSDSDEEPSLVYPISVTFDDNTTGSVNNQEEMDQILSACRGSEGDDEGDEEGDGRPEGDE